MYSSKYIFILKVFKCEVFIFVKLQPIYSTDDRCQLAKDALSEAIFKEEHAKASCKAANTALKLALDNYSSVANLLVTNAKEQEKLVWSQINEEILSCVQFFDEYRKLRYTMLTKASHDLKEISASQDIDGWTRKLESKLASYHKNLIKANETDVTQGFVLQLELVSSPMVDDILQKEADLGDNFQFLDKRICAESFKDTDCESSTSNDINSERDILENVQDVSDHITDRLDLKISKHESDVVKGFPLPKDNSSPSSLPSKQIVKNSMNRNTEMFLENFANELKDQKIPHVIQSFSCAYWPKETEGHMSPLLHGRMYVTQKHAYFAGWDSKKIIIKWESVSKVELTETFYGLVPNAILICCDSGEEFLFGSFLYRHDAFNILNRLAVVSRSVVELNEGKKLKASNVKKDEVLTKMNIIVNEKLANVSVDQVNKICWEGDLGSDNHSSFYGSWLESQDVNFDVEVGQWETEEGGYKNDWCAQVYERRRMISYKFKRTTHLYIGPPIASVTEIQYTRVEKDDTFLLASNVKIDGVPYADTFTVEYRWVGQKVYVSINFTMMTMTVNCLQHLQCYCEEVMLLTEMVH